MKISGKNLKRRLYGVSRLRDRVRRARYFRGHGVHSPFVYAIVRQVFMRRSLTTVDGGGMYDALIAAGIPRKRAVQLANLRVHIGAERWCIDVCPEASDTLAVVSAAVPHTSLAEYVVEARKTSSTLAIMVPYLNRDRDRVCREIVAAHAGTTVDNRGFLLVFNRDLPKQHFRL